MSDYPEIPSESTPPSDSLEVARARLAALGIDETDLTEQFILGDGAGGQKINKTHSCVQLRYAELGIEIRCQESRSRARNRVLAREMLADKIEQRDREAVLAKQRRRSVQRAKHRKPGKAAKKRFRASQQHHSRKKELRRNPKHGD